MSVVIGGDEINRFPKGEPCLGLLSFIYKKYSETHSGNIARKFAREIVLPFLRGSVGARELNGISEVLSERGPAVGYRPLLTGR